ncbi:hypothetical protein LTS15_006943 [Exophiala xenobiotica]|nr:hypothetical protein LTS15_006943 [Exophiala xenobiotica]
MAGVQEGISNLDREWMLAMKAFKSRSVNISEEQYRGVISACLNGNFGLEAPITPADLQQRIFTKVVEPLRTQLSRSFGEFVTMEQLDQKASQLEMHSGLQVSQTRQTGAELPEMAPQNAIFPHYPESMSSPYHNDREEKQSITSSTAFDADSLFGEEEPLTGSVADQNRTDAWLRQLNSAYRFRALKVGHPERIKIAVIDTGLDQNHVQVRANKNRIKAVTSWIDGEEKENDWGDETGHGTHITCMLLANLPYADIYVARITKTRKLEDRHTRFVARAIRKAREVWKIHLINLSFGFSEGNSYINDELQAAIAENILVFAAASNAGSNRKRSYPAIHPQVFCIHSADALGNSSKFNPSTLLGDDNFSTLGEQIQSAWPSISQGGRQQALDSFGQKRMSGTSFATPVAVIIAAVFMDLVGQMMPKGETMMSSIRTYSGMQQMFMCIAVQKNGPFDYRYLNPLEFLQMQEEEIKRNIRKALNRNMNFS